jgi:hypothetical protein
MSTRKREKLFLGTLEEFRFDFGGGDDDLPATGAVAGEEDEVDVPTTTTTYSRQAALTAEEVQALLQEAGATGSGFFALPSNASSLNEAVEQFRRQIVQLTRREAADQKRAKAQEAARGRARQHES